MQVWKGKMFTQAPACAQPSRLPAGLQLNITIMALSSPEWPRGRNGQGYFRQPRGSGATLECFRIGKSGLVIFHRPSQSSMLMDPEFSICVCSRAPSIGSLISPYKQAENLATNPLSSVNQALSRSPRPSARRILSVFSCFFFRHLTQSWLTLKRRHS